MDAPLLDLTADVRAFLKTTVEAALRRPHAYDWTLQGFGMLRCYLSKALRLHVWDARYRNAGVSMIHTHPWDFTSYIVAGEVQQYRYWRHQPRSFVADEDGTVMLEQRLQCGQGGGLCGQPEPVRLFEGWRETYPAGQFYSQQADEIHQSMPLDGTVTLCWRKFHEDEEHASVFYSEAEGWGTAIPRPAKGLEVIDITRQSLHKWFAPNPNYES